MIDKLIIVFHGGELSERLMRSVMVVLMLVAFKFQIERADIQIAAVKRIKLVAAGAIGAFHTTVQFGRSGRQHIQRDVEFLTGGFELGHELAAAIDLDRLDLERQLLLEILQKARGAKCSGSGIGAHEAQSGGRTGGFELLDRKAGVDMHAHVIDLDHLSGCLGFVGVAPALCVTVEDARFFVSGATLVEGGRQDLSASDPFTEHATDGAFAQPDAVLACQNGADFGPPPERMSQTNLAYPFKVLRIPLPATHPARSAAARLKTARALLRKAFAPSVVAGPGPADGFKRGGFAAAFRSQLLVQVQLLPASLGIIRKSGNGFADAVKFRVQMNRLHRVASCAFCFR